ncbi:hypothetical protein OMCYN_00962 [cyanobiont of Ornithocercus magnificus]|nr:hypothetical protein OMCYN_00962 [cyanobiont of Ornithocercus magnificus]
MRHTFAAALLLATFTTIHTYANTITVMPGESLSEVADRYGVSLESLVRLNRLRDPNNIEAGRRLIIPSTSGGMLRSGSGRHIVQSGDTLGTIAILYRVSERDLMTLNKLRDADHVELGQTLMLPSTAIFPQQAASRSSFDKRPLPIKTNPSATTHIVARGQTLAQIARAYQIPLATLISTNSIKNPDRLSIGTKILLRAPAKTRTQSRPTYSIESETRTFTKSSPPDNRISADAIEETPSSIKISKAEWRTYGPIRVDWANWQSIGGSYVAPTLNRKGQPLYLAINCLAKKINVTGAKGNWKTWSSPALNFERTLLKDRCNKSDV